MMEDALKQEMERQKLRKQIMNHDIKNGHVKIANTLLESIYNTNMTAAAFRVLLWTIRNSYGFNRKITNQVSIRKIEKQTRIKHSSIHRAINFLQEKEYIKKTQDGELFLNKEAFLFIGNTVPPVGQLSRQWDNKTVPPVGQSIPKMGQSIPKMGQSIPKMGHPLIIRKDKLKDKFKDKLKDIRVCAPQIKSVRDYCTERGNKIDPEKWFAFYESNGWMVGKNKMKDWKASVRYWERNEIETDKKKPVSGCPPIKGKYDGIGVKA